MPDWKRIVRERMAELNLEGAAEADLNEEFAVHLEDRYRELLSAGIDEGEAYRQTLSEMDDLCALEKAQKHLGRTLPVADRAIAGEPTGVRWVGDLSKDLRYAARGMRRNPLFVLFVVATLALGIGANATVFTVINTLLLNPIPVPDAAGLFAVGQVSDRAQAQANPVLAISIPDLRDLRARSSAFAALAGYTSPQVLTFQEHNASERLFGELVTGNYFTTLGLTPARGRFFQPGEDGVPGAHPVLVMNYGAWQSRFGGDPDIIGRQLRLNGVVFQVIGIAPKHFIGITALFGPDVWIPAAMGEYLFPTEMKRLLEDRSKMLFSGIGRLKPGVTLAQAQASVRLTAADLAREYPAMNEGHSIAVRPIHELLSPAPVVFATAGLLVVVLIVLLIACSNVANLLLARAASRQQEIAVRLAIGASRARLVRQLLTESMLLSLTSGVVGVGVALGGLRLLFASLPATANFITPKLDLNVFTFALAISLGTGLLFGIIPALKASRADIAEFLKQEARTAGKSLGKVNTAKVLMVLQVGFSFLLLAVATLFLRSIGHAYAIDPGFQTVHLALFMTTPGQAGYNEARTKAYFKEVKDRVERLPGVAAVAWSSNLPLWAQPTGGVEIEGREKRSQADKLSSVVLSIDPDYFDASGVKLERGRGFRAADRSDSKPVAIVNQKLAHDFFPNADAIGKRVTLPEESFSRQIVGIARNASYTQWAEPPQPCIYVPLEQHYRDGMTLYVRTKGDPASMMSAIQSQLRAAGPQVFVDVRTGRQIVDGGLFQARIGVALLSIFGLLALGLASIGLYGILAYSVAQRTREIGLRIALGADTAKVVRLVLAQGMRLVINGLVIGLIGAFLAGRVLARMLYGIAGSDLLSLGAAAVILILVALAACYLPARAASRVDPLLALREG